MKKLFLLLAMVGLVAISCEGGLDNEENGGNTSPPKIELLRQTIEVDFEPNTYTVSVTSPYSWKAESDNEWIVVESKTGIAGTEELSFRVECNDEEKERKGTILLTNSAFDLATELYVTQKKFIPKFSIEPEALNFAAEGGTQEVTITSNFEYEVSTDADWFTITETENGIVVSVSNYYEIEERSADITILSEKYNISKTVKVTQNGLRLSEEEYAKRCIFYTSSDGEVITPYKTDVFGANIVSNTYENGKGVITFDDEVTSIGDSAFENCSSLTSITIPDRVTEIGEAAFYTCSSLTSITIPDSVTEIGKGAFYMCSGLTSITIPDSITTIGDYTFTGCISLTSITIPDSVTEIGEDAFFNCSSLTSVTIPDSVTTIGEYAFGECSSLEKFYGKFASEDNRCLIIDGVLNSFAPAGLTSYTIPNSVTSIGYAAFNDCSSLTSITIPDSIATIGDYAFNDCSSLTSITIPNGVTSIGDFAFVGCSSLTSITIPDSITMIGEYAFYGCRSLTSITIPDSVTTIADYAFYDCRSLTSITIPDSITTIEDYAFFGCSSLTSITIPDSITTIGDYAFFGCHSLTSVYCQRTTPPTGGRDMFDGNVFGGRKIYVPTASVDAYKAADGWRDYASDIVGYNF